MTHFTFLALVVLSLLGSSQASGTLTAAGIMVPPAAARFRATGIGGLAEADPRMPPPAEPIAHAAGLWIIHGHGRVPAPSATDKRCE